MHITNLKTENAINPIGVSLSPRFSWNTESNLRAQKQTAYRLSVYSEDNCLIWDSGKVLSNKTYGIQYGGKPLNPQSVYFWQVTAWDKDDKPSTPSIFAQFETGLNEETFKTAKWISAKTQSAPLFQKEFTCSKQVKKARVYLTGLGFNELFINGEKVGNALLEPTVTRYDKRFFYSTYDVTNLLKESNIIGVLLGRGCYSTLANRRDWQVDNWANAIWADERKLRLIATVFYTDGSWENVCSDLSWHATESPLIFDEPFFGEEYDATKEQTSKNDRKSVYIATSPSGILEPAPLDKITLNESISKAQKTQVENGVFLFDFGKIISGWCKITVNGSANSKIKIQYAETLKNGRLNREYLLEDSTFDNRVREGQTDYYILNDTGIQSWQPRFNLRSFRYAEITIIGETDIIDVTAQFVHTALEKTGDFECSNQTINKIHTLCISSLLNNLHGYPSDTPTYENLGYLADGYLTQNVAYYNFDGLSFYQKWIDDIRLQAKENGYIEQTAPMWDEDKDNAPEWSLAMIISPWQHYSYCGDVQILEKNYPAMKKVFSYQLNLTENLIAKSMWGDLFGKSNKLCATAILYQSCNLLYKIATILKTGEENYFYNLSLDIKASFNNRFFNQEKGFYCEDNDNFSLGTQILPLAFDLVENGKKAKLIDVICAKIPNLDNLDCGIFSTRYLFETLCKNGLGDLAFNMLTSENYHAYAYILTLGATALWEQWNENSRSFSHHMLGSIDEFLYKTIGGINLQNADSNLAEISPLPIGDLIWGKATTLTVNGKIYCSWQKQEDCFILQVEIPCNTTAIITIPNFANSKILESGISLEKAQGVKIIKNKKEFTVLEVGSGKYFFKA